MIGDHEPNRRHSGGGGLTFSKEDREQKKLGKSFVQAAKECNAFKLQKLLDRNAPVNATDFPDGATALHYVAAYRARPALRVLLKSGKCNFLARDRHGRLPSQLAREFGRDDAMARLLLIKEVQQAQVQGIDPASLYKRSARRRAW